MLSRARLYVLLVIARPEFFPARLHKDASDNPFGITPQFVILLNRHYASALRFLSFLGIYLWSRFHLYC